MMIDHIDKPYFSLSAYLKAAYGEKIYKIALDGGFTCPNRDGTIDSRGCIFCSAGGSGEFATPVSGAPLCADSATFTQQVHAQIAKAIQGLRYQKVGKKFIAYFQAYTNTYGDPFYLYALYRAALSHPMVIGISIATRPDCLDDDVLEVLAHCQSDFPDKFLWIELGLQTIHEQTAAYIRRGYPLSCFESALQKLALLSIPVIVHIILGLPGETDDDVLQTIAYLNDCHIFGIKLQLLHVLKNTDLALDYQAGKFEVLTKEHYLTLLISCIEHLDPSIVLHRVTGDGPASLLIAPTWSLHKKDVLNSLHRQMAEGDHFQGRLYPNTDIKKATI